jgi:septum site-determining protein MinC
MSKDIVQIKGTRHGLVITIDGTRDFGELRANLQQKIERSKGFFKGAKFIFQTHNALINPTVTQELQAYCTAHGLVYDPEIPFSANPAKHNSDNPKPTSSDQWIESQIGLPDYTNSQKQVPAKKHLQQENPLIVNQGLTAKELQQTTLLVKHNLRSGQKILHPGNVVILGDVNAGADVVAGGNIVIMGILRGIAHAGASGDTSATITAYNLKPTQIRIAQSLSRAPDDELLQISSAPEMAKIVHGQIVIEQLSPASSSKKF